MWKMHHFLLSQYELWSSESWFLLLFQIKFFHAYMFHSISDRNYCVSDKRVLILVLAQASIHFAVSAFWFLWAPTIVVLVCTDVLFLLVLSLVFCMLRYSFRNLRPKLCCSAHRSVILVQADGRYTQLSLIYPCFLASRMLGSAGFPWFYGATAPFQNEDSLTIAYIGAGLALSIVAYDYQVWSLSPCSWT